MFDCNSYPAKEHLSLSWHLNRGLSMLSQVGEMSVKLQVIVVNAATMERRYNPLAHPYSSCV